MASDFDAMRLADLLEHEAGAHGPKDYKHKAAAMLRSLATQPTASAAGEREAYVTWLSDTYPDAWTREAAEHNWRYQHVSMLAWQARAALASKPPQAEQKPQAEYLDKLIDRLKLPPESMTAKQHIELCDEAAAMLHLLKKNSHPEPVAPPAREAHSVLQIGSLGTAYDSPNTRRAFTYTDQPGNVPAWKLGEAVRAAAEASAGDPIDRGLSLLKAMQDKGFGVFELGALSATPPAQAVQDKEDAEPLTSREMAAIGRSINNAPLMLPSGASVRIELEKDAGTVYWLDMKVGAWRHVDGGGEPFSEQINAAIRAARGNEVNQK